MIVSSAVFTKTVPALEIRDIVLNMNCRWMHGNSRKHSALTFFNLFTKVSRKIYASMISHNIPAPH